MIKFPRMHIATSVVNRILNAADTMQQDVSKPEIPASSPAPLVPDPTAEGEALNMALLAGPGEMPPLEDDPASDTAAAMEPILQGGTALEGLLETVSVQ